VKKQERTLHKLHDLFGNRAEYERVPAGDTVGGDYDHVNMFAIDYLHDVANYVISNFNAES
jgi:hypothetical protein